MAAPAAESGDVCSVQSSRAPRKRAPAPARVSPQLIVAAPASRPVARRRRRFHGNVDETEEPAMPIHTPDNELQRDFEPLRVALAVGALLLGMLFAL
jgi:hypothetical protein